MEDRDGARERNESQRERVPEGERPREGKERGERERGGLGTGVTWAGPEIDREFPSLRSPVKLVLRLDLPDAAANLCCRK